MQYIRIVIEHWVTLLLGAILGVALAVGLSFIPDQLYQSKVELLIVQRNPNVDAYTAQRTAERLGKNLVTIVESFDFLNKVIQTGTVNGSYYSNDATTREKQWAQAIDASVTPESSLITLHAYATSAGVAEDIALAVSKVLSTNASDYHGAGESIEIRQISGPITSSRPVKPNIPLNGVAGGVLGLMAVYTMWLLRLEAQRYKAEKSEIRYEVPTSSLDALPEADPFTDAIAPMPTLAYKPEYTVLDEFPAEGFNAPVSMHDHVGTETDTDAPGDTKQVSSGTKIPRI